LLLATIATGCSGDAGEPRDWLRTVCGSDAEIATPPPDRDYSDYRAEGVLTCSVPGRSPDSYYYVDAVAFHTDTDPRPELLSAVDGWESGDGVGFRYATRKVAGGEWAIVMSVDPLEAIEAGLDRLDGFDAYGSDEVFDRD
jgi:hypothetical protein